jgi:hypothetical protein
VLCVKRIVVRRHHKCMSGGISVEFHGGVCYVGVQMRLRQDRLLSCAFLVLRLMGKVGAELQVSSVSAWAKGVCSCWACRAWVVVGYVLLQL